MEQDKFTKMAPTKRKEAIQQLSLQSEQLYQLIQQKLQSLR